MNFSRTFRKQSLFWKDTVSVMGIVLAGILFFWRHLFLGQRTIPWDAADYFYPLLWFSSVQYRNGSLPLWNPYLFNGYPIYADPQVGTFYPVNLMISAFTEFTPWVVQVQLVLHIIMAGAFMYLLSRYLQLNQPASVLAGLTYMFSGFMIGHFQNVALISVISWLPLIYLFLDKAVRQKSISIACVSGVVLGISILGGFTQASVYIFYILSLHTLFLSFKEFYKIRRLTAFIPLLKVLPMVCAMGILVASIQILPTYELAMQSYRAKPVSLEYSVAHGQLSISSLIGFLIPDYFGAISGHYWGDLDISLGYLYAGILPMLLAGVVIMGRRDPIVIFFALMAILGILVSMGDHSILYPLLFAMAPGFNFFKTPVNVLFVFYFYLALIAGYGAEPLFRNAIKKMSLNLVLRVALCVLAFAILYYVAPKPPPDTASVGFGLERFLTVLMISLFLLIWVALGKASKIIPGTLLMILAFVDIYSASADSRTLGPHRSPASLERPPRVIASLLEDSKFNDNQEDHQRQMFRVYIEGIDLGGDISTLGIVGFNRAIISKSFLVDGFLALIMSRHMDFKNALEKTNYHRLLELSNAKYIVGINSAENRIYIGKVPHFLPRAYIVHRARIVRPEDTLQQLASPAFDPYTEVLLEEPRDSLIGFMPTALTGTGLSSGISQDNPPGKVRMIEYRPNRIVFETETDSKGYLVVDDTYYPGWMAAVDGLEQPIYRANYLFKAVPIMAGRHSVMLRFVPRSLWIGFIVTSVTILLIITFWGWQLIPRSRHFFLVHR